MARSKAAGDLAYRSLTAPWDAALELFRFAGASAPARERVESGWGAWDGERLVGALVAERAGGSAMLHGPVVVAPSDAPAEVAVEVASALLASALSHAATQGIDTLFTRPQGLDRIWVRHGFIPVPEAELPAELRGRPGLGLFGWRGGTALWSAAGRGAPRARALGRR
ncbi:MAG TPA: hypothetical protein VGT40_22510 [Methylomirabilota bacterium]|nr:hypothetical protein [Methylomirabilota bacterium]